MAPSKFPLRSDREVWRPIEGFDGYSVSSLGRVYSHKQNKLATIYNLTSTFKINGDYLYVSLGKQTFPVASLVAEAFLSKRPDGADCCHGMMGSEINWVGNLSWGSRRKNTSFDRNRDHIYRSRHPGVYFDKAKARQKRPWRVRTVILGENKTIGFFEHEYAGALAYELMYEMIEECEDLETFDFEGAKKIIHGIVCQRR